MTLVICICTYNRNPSLVKCLKSINNLSDLLNKFEEFKNLTEDELNKKKLFAKKQIKKFTQFAHFKSLKNIINLNE